jgi:hypothetical protein
LRLEPNITRSEDIFELILDLVEGRSDLNTISLSDQILILEALEELILFSNNSEFFDYSESCKYLESLWLLVWLLKILLYLRIWLK